MGTAVQVREELRRTHEYGTKHALARLVRRRWEHKPIDACMAEWGLTEGEARGLVYGLASQRTIDKIKQHPRGGWRIILEADALVTGCSVLDFIQSETARIENDRRRADAELARLGQMARALPAVLGVGSGGSRGGSAAEAGEPRSFGRPVDRRPDRGA